MTKDIPVERLEAFEDRLGVSLEGLLAMVRSCDETDNRFIVNGELHSREGASLAQDTIIVVSAHDTSGRVLKTLEKYFRKASFFGFEAFEISTYLPISMVVSKVRVYPKQG